MLIASVVQTVLDNIVQKIVSDQEQAEDQAGFRSSQQTTDHLATYRMVEQKCHEWSIKMWIATIDFMKAFDFITHKSIWKTLKSCGIKHDYISILKKIYRDRKHLYRLTKSAICSRSRKEPKQGDPLSSLLFNTVLQNSLKDVTQRWQKKKGMGINLSDHDHDCLTNLRFADDVFLFATSKERLQKMLCDFKESTEKKIEVDDTKVENTDKRRKREMLGPDDHVPATGDDRNQESNQGCIGDLPLIQTTVDIEKLHAQTSSPAVRRSNNSDDMLRIWNMDTHQRELKNDTIDATQNAPTHHTNKKKMQKHRETQS